MQRALYLVPLDRDGHVQPFACKLNEALKVGRTKSNGLPASVSREAVEVTAKLESGTQRLHVLVKSTAYVRRASDLSQTTVHNAGEELQASACMHACCADAKFCCSCDKSAPMTAVRIFMQLSIGEQIFLGKAEPENGFSVQVGGHDLTYSDASQKKPVCTMVTVRLSHHRPASAAMPVVQGALQSSPPSGRSSPLGNASQHHRRASRRQRLTAAAAAQWRHLLPVQQGRSAGCTWCSGASSMPSS